MQHEPICVALDAMSGDRGPRAVVDATAQALRLNSTLRVLLFGRREALDPLVARLDAAVRSRVEVVHATQVVTMDDRPADALRRKRDSSMRASLESVRDGRADAAVSAGNTGALMATARSVLKMLPGIDRPAIISSIPARGGHTHMLDLGANADCSAEQLFQFAVMGCVVASDVSGLARPRVGLLNIGEEAIKGNDIIRHSAQLLTASDLNYTGFVEGDDIFSGAVDVVVTDGFTGNVSLKTMEGAARMVSGYIRDAFARNAWTRLAGLVAGPVLRRVRTRLDPRRYNGASFVGLRGIVVKSHGGADRVAWRNAIETAVLEADKGVPTNISALLDAQRLEQAV